MLSKIPQVCRSRDKNNNRNNNFNYTRTDASTKLSPRFPRSMARKITRLLNNNKQYKGVGRVYTRRDLLLDRGDGESRERLDDELGLMGVSAGQTAARCGPWQLKHLWAKQ